MDPNTTTSHPTHRERWKEFVGVTFLTVFLSGFYGFIPFVQVPSLGIWYPLWGMAKALSEQSFPDWFTAHSILIPYGSPMLGGFLITWSVALLARISFLQIETAADVLGIAVVVLTLSVFVRIAAYMQIRRWIGYACGALFLILPFLQRHMDYGAMGIGFMLVPLSILGDLIILRFADAQGDKNFPRSLLVLFVKVFAVRLLIAGVDWYATVISMVGGGIVVLVYLLPSLIKA